MALVASDLKNEIIDVLESFNTKENNPSNIINMHTMIYNCIANYIKDNAKISGSYSGTLLVPPYSVVPPVPLQIDLSIVLIRPKMFSGEKSGGWIREWFSYMMNQIELSAMAMPLVSGITLTPPLNVFSSISTNISVPSNQNIIDNMENDPFYIWSVITEAIVNNIKNASLTGSISGMIPTVSQGQVSLINII